MRFFIGDVRDKEQPFEKGYDGVDMGLFMPRQRKSFLQQSIILSNGHYRLDKWRNECNRCRH